MPRALVAEAERSASAWSPAAAGSWSSGWAPTRCASRNELERLALWAGEGGEVGLEDLDAMVADTSEAIVWSLADALQRARPGRRPARSPSA